MKNNFFLKILFSKNNFFYSTQEVLNENDSFLDILEDCFEINEDYKVSKKELERRIKTFGIGNYTLKDICKELQKRRFKYDKNSTKTTVENGQTFKDRGIFKGIRLKPVITLQTVS